MRVGDQAQRFTKALRALYGAAGSPRYSDIVAYGAGQVRPVVFKDATLSDWLTQGVVPGSAGGFAALTALLEQLASQCPGYVRRSAADWEQLRSAARSERQASRGRRTADGSGGGAPPESTRASLLGVPVGQCDPLDLEVHPAGDGPGRDAPAQLPAYVRRAHDETLTAVVTQAVAGHSAMAVLIGSSSTGKTRACWEAVQPLTQVEPAWRLWHPFDPTRADAALAGLEAVGPHTVVWLNEAQHYLNAGEQLAAALHRLLTDPTRSPVLVLGTLWPEYDDAFAARPEPGRPDPHARTRELLTGRRIIVPHVFDNAALTRARELAEGGDRLLVAALGRGHEGRVAQHLAGAPELLARWHGASPGSRALLYAAADARRLGVGLHLPLGFLASAAPDYLDQDAYDALEDDWLEQALAELARPVHGNIAPLRRMRERPARRPPTARSAPSPAAAPTGPLYRLADYLEQHSRRERQLLCPPRSFWHAAHAHLTSPEDLRRLADSAQRRHRLQWANALYLLAADVGDTSALAPLARLRQLAGDRDGAEEIAARAADTGDTSTLVELARLRQLAGDWDGAEDMATRAADAGNTSALFELARLRQLAGDRDGAEETAARAADAGDTSALFELARLRERAGDRDGAETLYLRAADAGNTSALFELVQLRERAGDRDGAETLRKYGLEADSMLASPWSSS